MIWRRLAPMARRMPISRVRSVTEASMMFMMPMPPTSRLMAAMEPRTMLDRRLAASAWRSRVKRHADGVVLLLVELAEHPLDRLGGRFHVLDAIDLDNRLVQLDPFQAAAGGDRPCVHVAEVLAGHRQRDIGVHLLVGHLDVTGLAAFALDDADDLEVIAADPHPLADAVPGGQQLPGAELGQDRRGGGVGLVGGGQSPSGQDLPTDQRGTIRA